MNIVIDLETWGLKPGSDIRSIGACVVTSDGPGNTFYIACSGGDAYGLTRNPSTVQWWSEQSAAAQEAFANPVDLKEALGRLTYWLIRQSDDKEQCPTTKLAMILDEGVKLDDLRIWGHGASFDPVLLATAYDAVGMPVPWHYRAPRDTRTLFEIAGMDPHRCLEQFASGTYHHALDDALTEARAIAHAWSIVYRPRESHP